MFTASMSQSLKNNKHIYGYSLDEVTTTNQGYLSQLFGISSAVMQLVWRLFKIYRYTVEDTNIASL